MPDPDPTPPGFFGKLPSTGDFVTRGLPAAFVRFWDGWVSRHLVARLDRALRFFLGSPGPLTGVVLPSTDRAGRRYPLTLAARADTPAAPAWYAMLEAIAAAALAECLTPDALEARLATDAFLASARVAGKPVHVWGVRDVDQFTRLALRGVDGVIAAWLLKLLWQPYRAGEFGPAFVALARAVYRTNDRRAALKRRIDELTGSLLREEKWYPDAPAASGG